MDNQKIIKKLEEMTTTKKLLFGLCCVDRILRLYKNFDKKIQSQEYEPLNIPHKGYITLDKLLLEAFDNVTSSDGKMEKFVIKNNIQICLDLAPDSEEYPFTEAVLAQNASLALAYIYNFLEEDNLEYIIYASDKVIDTIDLIEISKMNSPEVYNKVMDTEMEVQELYIRKIEQLPNEITTIHVQTLREFNQQSRITL